MQDVIGNDNVKENSDDAKLYEEMRRELEARAMEQEWQMTSRKHMIGAYVEQQIAFQRRSIEVLFYCNELFFYQ